jgi:hypothetical protein
MNKKIFGGVPAPTKKVSKLYNQSKLIKVSFKEIYQSGNGKITIFEVKQR